MIKLIVAYDKNFLIGNGNKLPWNIKEEFNHFRKETLNKTILMGDVTFEGIGKPLPNRKTIILTKKQDYEYKHIDVIVETNFKKIIDKYKKNIKEDIIICGGLTIYKLFLPFVDEMIISEIEGSFEGDVFFPKWDKKLFVNKSTTKYNEFIVKRYKKINN